MPSTELTRVIAAAVAALAGCGGSGGDTGMTGLSGPVVLDVDAPPAERLSSYQLFTWDATAGFTFNDRVVPYDVNTALFSDYALKQRAIYLPDGAAATFDPEAALDFPVGSAIVKTFYYPADLRAPADHLQLIETRLLVRHADGWHPLPYIWDADQRDAVLSPSGEIRPIAFTDAAGAPQVASYLVPQRNECQSCHAVQASADAPIELVLLGVKARHLNRAYDYGGATGVQNQLDHLTELGLLRGAPAAAEVPAAYDFRPVEATGLSAVAPAELDAAARSYLDINCAHCHNPRGVQGMTSQLFLDHASTDVFHLGVCKRPGSAGIGNGGFVFDIVPGSPDTSILYYRLSTTKVGAMMPLLGRSLAHAHGAELIQAWIAAMPATDCGGAQAR